MTYEAFKTFINPLLLEEFTKVTHYDGGEKTYEEAVKQAYQVGVEEYNHLANRLANVNLVPLFPADTYILKRGFIQLYEWMLQNTAFLENLNLGGLGIKDSDIFDHFRSLRDAEKKDIDALREEALFDYREASGSGSKGFKLNHLPHKNGYGLNRSSRRW